MKVILSLFLLVQTFLAISQSEFSAQLDSILTNNSEEPGGCICIIKNAQVIYQKCQGKAVLEHDIELNKTSSLDIGTMAMHFTGAGILALAEEGKIKLDDSVSMYLPDFPSYSVGSITIQHLLNHTSGVRDYSTLLMLSGESFQSDFKQSDLYELILRQKALTIMPGTKYRFSQSNYLLLAEIIERVSGSTYYDFLKNRFFDDFKMDATTIWDDKTKVVKNRAHGYQSEGSEWKHDQRYNFTGYGDGRIYSSLEDLVKWSQNIQKNPIYGQLINRGVLSDGSAMTYANGLEYGLFNGHDIFAHSGYFGAFSSMYIDFVDLEMTIITLSNNEGISAPSLAYRAGDVMAPQKVLKAEKEEEMMETIVLSTEVLEEYVGKYFYRNYGYIREVILVDDTLVYKINDQVNRKLIPLSDEIFVALDQSRNTKFRFGADRLDITQKGGSGYEYIKYVEGKYNELEYQQIEGDYFSDELGVTYRIVVDRGNLKAYLKDNEIAVFRPIYKGAFTSEHDGFIEIDATGFYLNDYSLGRVEFVRKR